MYQAPPDLAEMQAAGLKPEDYSDDDEVQVWPESWPAIQLFQTLRTQWRVGLNGATGLDYGPLFVCLDRLDLDAPDRDDLFEDIQILEGYALSVMHEKKP